MHTKCHELGFKQGYDYDIEVKILKLLDIKSFNI